MIDPSVWYYPGAGGMWLNYLVWSGTYQHNFDGNLPRFEFPDLHVINPQYHVFLGYQDHAADPNSGHICLGSHRAWYNFYLNINTKKDAADDDGLYNAAIHIMQYRRDNIKFNLDWTLLWTSPEQFIADLNTLWPFNLKLDQYTARAIQQYQESCYYPDINLAEFQNNRLFKFWKQAIIDTETDTLLTMAQRDTQANEITHSLYWHKI